VVAGCFLLALFITPVLVAVPAAATAPALILVGAIMMQSVKDIDWGRTEDSVPAFLTLALMPLTYSIATGISFGILAWVLIKLLRGRAREVPPLLWVLAVLLASFYAFR